ncbi:UNVERIFIED_CONTAM: hypothetical protein Scaly_0265700 [Sesamum calycinum]|uniref:Uncharacterized protein n=1 Tax=Sesamum calycinum TaxID=2727403 RepID=A0AAW2SBJ7_9LAMI
MLGVEVVGSNALQSVILEYFSHIFSSSRPNAGVNEEIVACLEPKVTDKMNSKLLCPFTSEEVKQTRDVMHPLKFSRPDGMSLVLFGNFVIYDREEDFVKDPLSPYLFLSYEEASNGMKRRAEEEGNVPLHVHEDLAVVLGVMVAATKDCIQKIHWIGWHVLYKSKEKGGLGFKRLLYQNMAILSKQGWRIVVNPQGLAHQVLRAKYFPNPDFFTAPVGSNSSLWLSIFAARPLLMSSVRWDVGDGTRINVMGDPRLPRLSMFKLISSPKSLSPSVSVSLLPNEDHNWNQELIKEEFGSLDAECILQITTRTAPGTAI